MTGRRVLAAVLVAAATAGCGTASDHAEREALAALGVQASSPSPSSTSAKGPRCNVDASLRPPAAMPAPGAMPAGSDMAAIRRRGHLLVGVDQNTRLLAYWNPLTKRFTGFEIDIAHELARAIFGNPNAVEFRALTTDERIPAVQSGEVDLSIDAITITCARKQQVDFSTVYFLARQRLLVRRDSPLSSARDLAGHRVCATEGSTSLETIEHAAPRAIPDGVPQRTDCLVALEEGWVPAVTSDDAILLGFKSQDPLTKIVGPSLAPEPYGIAINKRHPDLVRFVNGVLAKLRRDGDWRRLYAKWFGPLTHISPSPPTASYDG